MRRLLYIFALIMAMSTCGQITVVHHGGGPPPNPAGDIFVSKSGVDSATCGAVLSPCATLPQAQIRIRTFVGSGNYANGINPVVIVEDGTYFLSTPLAFTSADNTESWIAMPNAHPVISGGFTVTGWTNAGGTTWVANIDPAAFTAAPETLYYNGQRRLPPIVGASGVTPQGDWFRIVNTVNTCGGGTDICEDRFVYSGADFNPGTFQNLHIAAGNPCGLAPTSDTFPVGNIEVAFHESFTQSIMRVNCFDNTNHIVYMTGSITNSNSNLFGYMVNHRYRVQNAKQATLFPGQWWLDQSQNPWQLVYKTRTGENPPTDTVILPQMVPPLITMTAVNTFLWQGITFSHDNTTIAPTGYGAQQTDFQLQSPLLKCLNCSNVTFNQDTFAHTMGHALWFLTDGTSNAVGHNTITNSACYDAGAGCFYFGDFPQTTNDTDTNVENHDLVFNNSIHGYGRFFAGSDAINFMSGNNMTAQNNAIIDGFHDGIGACVPTNRNCTGGVSSHGLFNIVADHNLCQHIGEGLLRDFGCVYFATFVGTGNVISNNIVHDINDGTANGDAGSGVPANCLYVDNVSQDVVIKNNLTYNCTGASIRFTIGPQTDGHPNIIVNNILSYTRTSIVLMGSLAPSSPLLQYVFQNNLVRFDRDYTLSPVFRIQSSCGPQGSPATASQNFFSNMYFDDNRDFSDPSYTQAFLTTAGPSTCHNTPQSWNAWQALGEDSGSLVQDQGFANALGRNFTLAASPGVDFVVFDLTTPGLSNPALVPSIPSVFQTWPIAEFSNSDF